MTETNFYFIFFYFANLKSMVELYMDIFVLESDLSTALRYAYELSM